ncbi:MAG: hypothetical protein ACRCZY_10965 [Phocaeicola sp.]
MALYLRYTENIQADIERGTSLHLSDFNLKDFATAEEFASSIDVDADEVAYIEDFRRWAQVLNGLCAFCLEAETLEEAIEEAERFRRDDYYTDEDSTYAIVDAKYVGDCPEGDLIDNIEVLYTR